MSETWWLLVDGNNLAYRHDAVLDLTTKRGQRVGAIYGFCKAISQWKLSLKYHTCSIIVFFDGGRAKERMALFPEYKAHRRKDQTPEEQERYQEFLAQCKYLQDLLPTMGVTTVHGPGLECDDLIAYYVDVLSDGENFIQIVSGDSDFEQLVSDRVSILPPSGNELYPKGVEEKRGLKPSQIAYWKALTGDSSDGIPGIEGVGEVRASKLLQEYPELARLEKPRPSKDKPLYNYIQKVSDQWDVYTRNYKLICLPSPIVKMDREGAVITKGEFDKDFVKKVFMRLEFVSLLTTFNQYWSSIGGSDGD